MKREHATSEVKEELVYNDNNFTYNGEMIEYDSLNAIIKYNDEKYTLKKDIHSK